MASQQQPRPMFRFASMIRPAPIAQPPAPAPPTPAPQPLFRPAVAAPIRPPASTTTTTTATTVTTTQPTLPQVPTPQTPAAALPPVVARPLTPPQPQPQPTALNPRSPILAPQPQPVAAASPRSLPTAPVPRSPAMAPAPVVVSPPKVPQPRSPPVAAQVPRSPINNVTASVPQSPFKTAPTSTPYSSLPPSPKTKLADSIQNLINQSSSSPPKARSPSQKVIQPNLVKTPTYSPQVKPAAISHPPSPLKLPPPQLDLDSNKIPPQVEQKTVVVQETTTRTNNVNGHHHVPHVTRNGRIEENGKREVLKKDKGVHPQKKVSNSEDFGTSVLTLAGENRGAIMELSPSRNNHNGPQQNLHKKLASPKAWSSSSEDESGSESGKAKKRDNKMSNNKNQLPMTAFMNSNVQGVNNSILHNASCTHHDPGVHLVFSRKSNGHGFHIKGSPKS